MQQLCFSGNYTKRFARVKEFCQDKVEVVLDEFLRQFCNSWLESEYDIQSGRERYQRSGAELDYRAGHYARSIITGRGVIELSVPRGAKGKYKYTLFNRFKRRTEKFEDIVVDALLKGHSSRKASRFFASMFGKSTISHQAAVQTLRRFDYAVGHWKARPIRDDALILVLDAVPLKGAIQDIKRATPVLFAYAIYPDGSEDVLDFEIEHGESTNAWSKFCQRLYERGLKNVKLVVHDDCAAIGNGIALCWPKALDQQCVFHILNNFAKKLKGYSDKHKIIDDVSWLYETISEEEFYRWLIKFKAKYKKYDHHAAFKYFFGKVYQSIRYFNLPREYWTIAKTSNRLERFFEELKRRIKVFRRFPNSGSCKRWLYALLIETKPNNISAVALESQHSS
ncbi:MAG: IS256 family transposase [Candidatus Omnitrophota bacterium]|nr:IS256 family transposase [Candidatus Omnitrophota bacterium]